jgi:glucokinase
MSDAGPILGIDIGGTKLAVAVVQPNGQVLVEDRQPSQASDGPDAMIERVIGMSRAAMADARGAAGEVAAIGIGCGGPLDPWRGVVLNALNNPGWVDIPLVERIQDALGRPAYLDNDANAAALGEHRFGAGRGVGHMVYLTISTGVGGGVILDHRLYRGANGNAAELGHISVAVHGGRPCHCGSVGCLEMYASGTSIAARYREALGPDAVRAITAVDVTDAVRRGDPTATAVWDETMELLGGAVASIIHAFNPQLVVLGGGVTHSGDLLFEPVRRVVKERAMPWLAGAARIVPADLGRMTGVLGAVAVALDRMEQPALAS